METTKEDRDYLYAEIETFRHDHKWVPDYTLILRVLADADRSAELEAEVERLSLPMTVTFEDLRRRVTFTPAPSAGENATIKVEII